MKNSTKRMFTTKKNGFNPYLIKNKNPAQWRDFFMGLIQVI